MSNFSDDFPALEPGHVERAHNTRRSHGQRYRVQQDFDSLPNKTTRNFMAILAGGALVVGAFILSSNSDKDPSPDKVKQVSACAQDGLSQLALNGYSITHEQVVVNVNVCAEESGVDLSAQQQANLIASLEQAN